MKEITGKVYRPVLCSYGISLILISASISFDIFCLSDIPNWVAFQRSGSVVVVVSIVAIWYSVNKWLKDKKRRVKGFLADQKQCIPELTRKETGYSNKKYINYTVKKITSQIHDSTNSIFNKIEKKFYIHEMILAATGTIIWGYGDLLPFIWGAL